MRPAKVVGRQRRMRRKDTGSVSQDEARVFIAVLLHGCKRGHAVRAVGFFADRNAHKRGHMRDTLTLRRGPGSIQHVHGSAKGSEECYC